MAVLQKADMTGTFMITATVDPASLTTDAIGNTDITGQPVLATDLVMAIPPAALVAGVVVQSCSVPAAGTIRIRLSNTSAGTIDVASGTWQFLVFRR